jgi:hypothetical protein
MSAENYTYMDDSFHKKKYVVAILLTHVNLANN